MTASDWTDVTRDVSYTHDLKTTPLQIKTNSTAGSGEVVWVKFFTVLGDKSGGVRLKFNDPLQYKISLCMSSNVDFPEAVPAEQIKIWTITETATSVKISCNEVDVFTYTFSDSFRDECVSKWSNDTVKIKFTSKYDTASDQFRVAGTSGSRNTITSEIQN